MTNESYIEELEHSLAMMPADWEEAAKWREWAYRAGPEWAEILVEVVGELARLEAGLLAMKRECLRLEADGMYPAVPSFNWETRSNSTHGEKRYLRLEFPAGTPGFEGSRCRVYVGCKADKIADAERKAANRRRWEKLDAEITRLERFLQMTRGDLRRVAGNVERYRLPEDLVTEEGGPIPAAVPKEEWVLTGPEQVEYRLGEAARDERRRAGFWGEDSE